MSASANIKKMMERLKKADQQTKAKALRRMDQFTAKVMGDSMEGTPVATGNLQSSHSATPATIEADGNIKAGFGANTNYAAIVHETWEEGGAQSKNDNPNARKKFMELAIKENQPKLVPFVGKDLI
jgi:hypothetical protein